MVPTHLMYVSHLGICPVGAAVLLLEGLLGALSDRWDTLITQLAEHSLSQIQVVHEPGYMQGSGSGSGHGSGSCSGHGSGSKDPDSMGIDPLRYHAVRALVSTK